MKGKIFSTPEEASSHLQKIGIGVGSDTAAARLFRAACIRAAFDRLTFRSAYAVTAGALKVEVTAIVRTMAEAVLHEHLNKLDG
jgi:hypothetical protein